MKCRIDDWTLEMTVESDVRMHCFLSSKYGTRVLIRNVILRGRNQDLKSSKSFLKGDCLNCRLIYPRRSW